MGAEPYFYFVPYQQDVASALAALRGREFAAGRYNPVTPFPSFPLGEHPPAPGAAHASIEDALLAAGADGTRSILDLNHVAEFADFCTVAALDVFTLEELYGSTEPTREMIEENRGFFDHVERGQGVCIVVYKDGRPDELFFAGYSFD